MPGENSGFFLQGPPGAVGEPGLPGDSGMKVRQDERWENDLLTPVPSWQPCPLPGGETGFLVLGIMGSLSWLGSKPGMFTVEFPSSSEPLHCPLPTCVFSGTCLGPPLGLLPLLICMIPSAFQHR